MLFYSFILLFFFILFHSFLLFYSFLLFLTFLFSFVVEGLNPNGGANMDLENPAPYVNPVESPIYLVLLLVSLVWSLYLLFGNSKVKKHIG